jgi:hypothetical protein
MFREQGEFQEAKLLAELPYCGENSTDELVGNWTFLKASSSVFP